MAQNPTRIHQKPYTTEHGKRIDSISDWKVAQPLLPINGRSFFEYAVKYRLKLYYHVYSIKPTETRRDLDGGEGLDKLFGLFQKLDSITVFIRTNGLWLHQPRLFSVYAIILILSARAK